MSWSFSAVVTKDNAAEVLSKIELPYTEHAPAEMLEQAVAAAGAVITFIESGVLGDGEFVVNMSGHANPGHGDTSGWSKDAISLNVSRRTPEAAPAAAA